MINKYIQLIKRSAFASRYGAVGLGYLRLNRKIFKTLSSYQKQFASLLPASNNPKKILLAGSVGMNPDNLVQTLVGMGLKARGSEVDVLICDGVMKGCFNCKYHHFQSPRQRSRLATDGPGSLCNLCIAKGKKYLNLSGLKGLPLSQYIDEDDRSQAENVSEQCFTIEQVRATTDQHIAVGQHAYAGAVRFFASPDLTDETGGLRIAKAYLYSSILVARAAKKIFRECPYDRVVLDHGIYVPQGVIAEVAIAMDIKVSTFATGYRKHSFIFADGGSYHYVLPALGTESLACISDEQRELAREYVESRASGKNDWVLFQEKNRAIENFEDFGIQDGCVNIVLFTNVLWDAQIHFKNAIFKDSLEWLCETIEFLVRQSNVNLILRIHPGEIKGFVKSRVGVERRLRETLPDKALAKVKILPAASEINSYDLARKADFSIVDGSKIGIDLCALGLPVVVAGDCWTRGKGISIDVDSKEEYFETLCLGISRGFEAPNEKQALALAYYIYFDRMKEIPFVSKAKGDPPFELSSKLDEGLISNFNDLLGELEWE